MYVVLANAAGDDFSPIGPASFATIRRPLFNILPRLDSVAPFSAEIYFGQAIGAKYYWVLLPDSTVTAHGAPDADQVRMGQDGSGTVTPLRGPDDGAPTDFLGVTLPLSGLSAGTSYQLFVVLANAADTAFSDVAPLSFTTDPAPPSFTDNPEVFFNHGHHG